MKLTITIEANEIPDGMKIDRLRLNNIWANCNSEISQFIQHEGKAVNWNVNRKMGVQPYNLTIKIEP